jgi:hypothetical protein
MAAIRSSADASEQQGTFKMDFTIEMTGLENIPGASGQDMSFTGHTEVDSANDMQKMSMEIPFAGTMEAIQDGTTMYMKGAAITSVLGGTDAKPWIKIDTTATGQDMSQFQSMSGGTNNPAQMMAMLRGVSGDLQEVGTDTIDGVETTQYHGTLDLEKAIQAAPQEQQAEIQAALDQLKSLGSLTFPFDVWVDGDGLVRRLQLTFDLSQMLGAAASQLSPGTQIGMVMTMNMYDYGQPVDIQVPPASQVTDASDLATALDATWQEMVFITGPGPAAGGSKSGQVRCAQMPEKSGIGAALGLALPFGPTPGAATCAIRRRRGNRGCTPIRRLLRIAPATAHDVLMPDVRGAGAYRRQSQCRAGEIPVVDRGQAPARGVLGFEMAQLDPQDRRLNFVQAAVHPRRLADVALAPSVLA